MQATERIFHLSHTDLDGYGSQFMVSQAFYNCAFFNCDYKAINPVINQIIKQIKLELLTQSKVSLLLITDLNLTMDQADWLQRTLDKIPGRPELLLLDHHATGVEVAKKHAWYQLDTSQCATRLSCDWVKQFLPDEATKQKLQNLSELVNVTDMWIKQHPSFNKANFLADIMFEKPWYPPEMTELGRYYRFHLIQKIFEAFQDNKNIAEVEHLMYQIKEDFLSENHLDQNIVEDTNIALDGKFYHLVLQRLFVQGLNFIKIDGMNTLVFYAWTGPLFQHISSMLFELKPEIDVAIRISSNGKLSFRSHSEKNNVSLLAQKYFNGGGHPCAAGGSVNITHIDSYDSAVKILTQYTSKSK